MTAGFGVDPAQLRRHAATVGDLAERLGTLSRSTPAGLGDQSLGSFVQFLTAGLQSAATSAADAVSHASSTVDKVSANLTRAAEGYERREQHNGAALPGEGLK
ncbi:type VII secretion target [Amycolatopsis saalfeldensis]|uniref:Excreted virulence factor EspC, type VII ESX diderm n=1 Tax=Amycolatopsis saalfeldensis TaxID=394193 RepID=A0A1H8YGM9_9PSEU|nr:type VII secretion target [Amycolatopsis saalfeldensis]SEP51232.1 Excreted virulence factor EspC, type VII ESX diderm [Amycolatopsis saalfeldensis]